MNFNLLNESEILLKIKSQQSPANLMYSSYLGGWTDQPWAMTIPLDDHMVHRGDGVFEAVKYKGRCILMLEPHLNRLINSAQKIGLKLNYSFEQLVDLVKVTVSHSALDSGIIRIFVSRGGGSFSPNPYDPKESHLFILTTALAEPSAEMVRAGVRLGISAIPQKVGWLATVKSCNYLNNVLMKKEAVDAQLDFMVGVDSEGFLLEGPTENLIAVDAQGVFLIPTVGSVLEGVTLKLVLELLSEKRIPFRREKISVHQIIDGGAAMMAGTTIDCLWVSEFMGTKLRKNSLVDEVRSLIDGAFVQQNSRWITTA